MSATLPSGNWHPLLWLGTLFSPVCLHVGSGSGANEPSSGSAKYPIKRLHTWHVCAAGLRSASQEEVSQAQAGRCSVSTEQRGWGPSDLGWLLPSFLSPSVPTSGAGIAESDLVTWVSRIFFLEEPKKPSNAYQCHVRLSLQGMPRHFPNRQPALLCATLQGSCSHLPHLPDLLMEALASYKSYILYGHFLFLCTDFCIIFIT